MNARAAVELPAGLGGDHSERFLVASGRPVRTRRADGVECVGDGDDPSFQRNPLARQAVRVAAAIPALMMAAHGRYQPRVADARDHRSALAGVALGQLKLGGGQTARLAHELGRA